MPINSANSGDTSQLLREISRLNLSGSSSGFKYVKYSNCDLLANTESMIVEGTTSLSLREVLLISNTPNSIIELFWDDGTNKVRLPDKLNDDQNRYLDTRDGGLSLSVLSNINSNIDVYIRSTKPITEKIGNAIVIPEIEEEWYSWIYDIYGQHFVPFKVPIKPVYIIATGWEEVTEGFLIYALPITAENGREYENEKIIGNIIEQPLLWSNFDLLKEYEFYGQMWIPEYGYYYDIEFDLSDETSITQDAKKWIIMI